MLDFARERLFETEYAHVPYPLATVRVNVSGPAALVERSFAAGPLAADGTLERWRRADGAWRLSDVLSSWHL